MYRAPFYALEAFYMQKGFSKSHPARGIVAFRQPRTEKELFVEPGDGYVDLESAVLDAQDRFGEDLARELEEYLGA